jgi:hypothetical protein
MEGLLAYNLKGNFNTIIMKGGDCLRLFKKPTQNYSSMRKLSFGLFKFILDVLPLFFGCQMECH